LCRLCSDLRTDLLGFRRSLSKRLLTQKIKEDWEQHFLTKLKGVCGDAYTKKLTGMLVILSFVFSS
jgi:hypothetical protein